MNKLRYVFRNVNLLNIMLAATLIFIANYTVLPMFNPSFKYTLPAGKKTAPDTNEKPVENPVPSLSDYALIAEENIFHPERKIPPEKKEAQPLPKPDFVLYGTLMTDNLSLAYLEDLKAPYNTPGRGKRQRAMRTGDSLSGFTLKEIETEKVVMVRGEERIIVPLTDPSHSKDRKETGLVTATPVPPARTGRVSASVTKPPKEHPKPAKKEKEEKEKEKETRQKPDKRGKNRETLIPSL